MLRRFIVSVILIAIFLAGAIGVAGWLVKQRPHPERVDVATRAVLVNTLLMEPHDAVERLYGYGSARAYLEATLTAEVSAPVVELVGGLEAGMPVEKGQVLVRLDDQEYVQELQEARSMIEARKAELAQVQVERQNLAALLEIAQSDLTLNRTELDRVEKLFSQGHAPKTELDSARLKYQGSLRAVQALQNQVALLDPQRMRTEAELAAAQSRLERAQLNIERCRIEAPFEGVVRSVAVDIGDRIRIGGEIAQVVNLDRIEIPIQMPVSTRPRVDVGAGVVLSVESMPEIQWMGRIVRIAPVADERSRTFEAYAEVDNRGQSTPLLPGFFVRAEVEGPMIADALIVPRDAVVDGKVYVFNDGHAYPRRIQVIRYLDDRAAVTGELGAGDRVITTNLDILYEGAPVRSSELNTAPDADEAVAREPGEISTGGVVTAERENAS